jgi:hypothetical protein
VARDRAVQVAAGDVLVSGAKGVDGGGVLVTGTHPGWS